MLEDLEQSFHSNPSDSSSRQTSRIQQPEHWLLLLLRMTEGLLLGWTGTQRTKSFAALYVCMCEGAQPADPHPQRPGRLASFAFRRPHCLKCRDILGSVRRSQNWVEIVARTRQHRLSCMLIAQLGDLHRF